MTESRQHRMLVKLYDILQAAVMVYGPLDEQQIEEIISLYYGKKYEKYYPYIQEMLELLCQNDMEKDENGRYSIIPFEIVDEISHMIEMASGDQDVFLPQKKFESADRFISFADPFDPDNLPSMRRLYDYIYSLNIPEQLKDEFYHVGVIVAIQMADPEDYLEIISHKSTEFVDEDKLVQIIDDMVQEFPRGFFNGNSLSELKNLHEEKRLEDEKDRIQPKEKPSEKGHSYRECMELTDDLSGRKILQYLDSESLMEFLVNGEQAYLVVNRFDDEKLLLCIMSREELEDNYHLIVNADNYPDMMMRTSGIFVALNDQGELAEPIEDELPYEEDDPRHSIIRYYCMKRYSAVEDQQDIDRLFGVLSDLSAIDSEDNYQILADKDSWAEGEISQIYVYPDGRVEYGNYIDYSLYVVNIPFKVDNLTEDNDQALSECSQQGSIGLGIYASSFLEQNTEEAPYLCFIYDQDSDQIIDVLIKMKDQMSTIANDLADILIKNDIAPGKLVFNNEFTMEVFAGFIYYCEEFEYDQSTLDDLWMMYENMMERDQQDDLLS